jgi:hypothetical protein
VTLLYGRIDRQPRVRILSKVIEIITCTLLVEG